MNKKLYVGNLNYATTEEELHQLFTEVGQVTSAVLVTDRITGQSRGFGFVEMATEKAAEEAIQRLNNHEMHEHKIVVSEARPPRERSFGDGGRGRDNFSRGGGGRGGSSRGGGGRGGSSRGGGQRRRY